MTKRLAAEIVLVLCAKIAALGILYFAFFSAPAPVDARAAAIHLTGADDGHR